MFHECLHATDLYINKDVIVKNGLCNVDYNEICETDTMFNECANVLAASLISSDKPMYEDDLGINVINNGSYEKLNLPNSIICTAFDITEIEMAKLKDKGRENFETYLKNKFPYLRDEILENNLTIFAIGLNTIWNVNEKEDKENVTLGLGSIIDSALELIRIRLDKSIGKEENKKETLERIYYDIYKIKRLLEKVDGFYQIDEEKEVYNIERFNTIEKLLERVHLYNRFIENKGLFSKEETEKIYDNAKKCGGFLNDDIIKSKLEEDFINQEFDIEKIAKKYYLQSNEPLNNNTKLIEQVKNKFRKPINKRISEKMIELVKKVKYRNLKELPLPGSEKTDLSELEEFTTQEQETEHTSEQKVAIFRNSVKYEIHNESTGKETTTDNSRDDGESTRYI